MSTDKSGLEAFTGETLHPSLDIKEKITILGFRYKPEPSKVADVYLVVTSGSVELLKGVLFEKDENKYFIDKSKRKLAWLNERWSLEKFNSLLNGESPELVPVEVFDEVHETIKKYIELERNIDYILLAAWIIGTYFYPAFSAYPMLNIKGPKGSGKSQCLNLLRQFCFNAIKARPTLAALGDTVDSLRGTYLIDQADSLNRKGSEDLLDTITDSYKKSGGKRRIVDMSKKGAREVIEFEIYSPKAFASIKELPQDLRDRCLPVPLIRSNSNFHDPDEDSNLWLELRDKFYRLLVSHASIVRSSYSVSKVTYRQTNEIRGRQLELWLPIEAILKTMGQEGQITEAKSRFLSQYGFSEYEPTELDEGVIMAILDFAKDKEDVVLSPRDIANKVESSLLGWGSDKQKAAKVGWVIKGFNLASEKLPRNKEGYRYSFNKVRIIKIFDTYFKSSEKHTPTYTEGNNILKVQDPTQIDLPF